MVELDFFLVQWNIESLIQLDSFIWFLISSGNLVCDTASISQLIIVYI